jgi:hypothetical protein
VTKAELTKRVRAALRDAGETAAAWHAPNPSGGWYLRTPGWRLVPVAGRPRLAPVVRVTWAVQTPLPPAAQGLQTWRRHLAAQEETLGRYRRLLEAAGLTVRQRPGVQMPPEARRAPSLEVRPREQGEG